MLFERRLRLHHDIVTLSSHCCGTVLSERKGLCPHKLAALLLHSSQATFTGSLVFFGSHFDIVLWETTCPVIGEERAVPSIKYIYLRICELGILVSIRCSILVADVLGPKLRQCWPWS